MDGNTVAILGAFLSGLLMIAWQGRADRRAFRKDLKDDIRSLDKKMDEGFKEVRRDLVEVKVELADVGGQLKQINWMVHSGQPSSTKLQAVDPELIVPEVDQDPEADSPEVVESQQSVAAHKG